MRHLRILLLSLGLLTFLAAAAPASISRASAKVTLHHKCITKYSFCVNFPYVVGAEDAYKHLTLNHETDDSTQLDGYSSTVYRNASATKFCKILLVDGCRVQEVYYVEVLRSKESDPWTALTSIHGGIPKPVRTSRFLPDLAIRFKGLYGPVGYAIYHRKLVYYVEAGVLQENDTTQKPLYSARFFSSLDLH